jgi:hypothetical protein
MVERYISKLRLTPEEYNAYHPPTGVDMIKLEEGPGFFVVAFVGSDLFPNPLLRKTAADIRHEITTTPPFRNRILEDNLQTHPNLPARLMKIETVLDHPNVTRGPHVSRELKMAAEAATEVHNVELTKEQFEEIDRDNDTGHKMEPKEIRRKTRQVMEKTADGRVVTRDTGHVEESYIVQFGIVDIG